MEIKKILGPFSISSKILIGFIKNNDTIEFIKLSGGQNYLIYKKLKYSCLILVLLFQQLGLYYY